MEIFLNLVRNFFPHSKSSLLLPLRLDLNHVDEVRVSEEGLMPVIIIKTFNGADIIGVQLQLLSLCLRPSVLDVIKNGLSVIQIINLRIPMH